jgi:hypothetical protein
VVADKAKVTGEASKTPTTLPAAVAAAAAAVGKPINKYLLNVPGSKSVLG